ncbi:hypothetical protein GPJ56_003070 [Histomonas meleagridis]|uniref:uncharacterized protein n=1 Tax=Histomonas meleagridis TaxID=135588 RepID=UPI00355A82B7|nr:hypothetical protein GPJ56_003070 [Histomonas meleagridis]KAH0805156.1 hypothetical protein GO595_002101 [Histomonas meleagridis]
MSLEQNLPQEEPKLVCDSDSKFLKAQKKIREKWIYLQRLQDRVFEEDLKSISEDNEQWEKFSSDFKSHNHSTHQMIDQQLSSLTNKTNELRNNYDDLVRKKSEQLKKLEKKYEEIQEKSKSNLTFLSEKSLNERDKIRNDASEQCNIVRSRVREIERKNLVRVSHMKEKDNILQRKENDLVQETDELSSDIEKIININKGIADEGAARIKSLENQLNAIISATTAVPNENDIVHERILNAVSTAIGKHARSARNVENVNLQIQSLNKKKKILREHC